MWGFTVALGAWAFLVGGGIGYIVGCDKTRERLLGPCKCAKHAKAVS